MARQRKTSPPPEGAAFAMPLEDGRYSACRVILGADHERAREEGGLVLAAGSAWIGDALPAADDPRVRPILWSTRHKRERNLSWMLDELPKSFVPIGTIRPTAAERRLACNTSCVWEGLAFSALVEWRWQHDRKRLLAEEAAEKAEAQARAQAQNQRRAAELARLTLAKLARRTFFADWAGYVEEARIRESRKIMASTIAALRALGPRASEPQKLKVLRRCIEQFNKADQRHQYIDTLERDTICEEFYLICCACGFADRQDLPDEWREW